MFNIYNGVSLEVLNGKSKRKNKHGTGCGAVNPGPVNNQ